VLQESWRTRGLGQSRAEFCLERSQVELCDVRIGNEDICRGRESPEDGVHDVRDQMESAVDGFFSKDGYFQDVWF
jgi:hypothetical protein